jgi:HK97 family phage portal protein
MGLIDWFRKAPESAATSRSAPHADIGVFVDLDDPRVADWLRLGFGTASGQSVNPERALKNTTMFRAVSLISYSIGMLPLHLINDDTKEKAKDHSLYRVLHREPNTYQTAFDFKTLMQLRALIHGNAYARIFWSKDLRTGRDKVIRLVPMDPRRTTPRQLSSGDIVYRHQPANGVGYDLAARDVFHLRGVSLDGIVGLSLVTQAAEAIGLALAAELAASKLFKNGSLIDGTLEVPKELSAEAYERLKKSWAEQYSGAGNAGGTPILEDGVKHVRAGSTARDAQLIEVRRMQVEEIARVTGVPRPLLMVDETSWGSGIEALGRFFVQYALNPWFEAWQQAIERSLLVGPDKDAFAVKFNAAALLRGSMKDQADFLSKALGSGGARGWMSQVEVRDTLDMPPGKATDTISQGAMGGQGDTPPEEDETIDDNDPARAAARGQRR